MRTIADIGYALARNLEKGAILINADRIAVVFHCGNGCSARSHKRVQIWTALALGSVGLWLILHST
jgi:hypothetical protein